MAGITEDLERILQLGPDAEAGDMLDVASSILRKIVSRDIDPEEAVASALAIVNAVKSRLANEPISFGGSPSSRAIASSLRGEISNIRHSLVCKDQNRCDAANIARQLSGESRRTVILSASRDFDDCRKAGPMLCDRQAWINQTLREAGMPTMSQDERTLVPVD